MLLTFEIAATVVVHATNFTETRRGGKLPLSISPMNERLHQDEDTDHTADPRPTFPAGSRPIRASFLQTAQAPFARLDGR